jgi:hypothetical protein
MKSKIIILPVLVILIAVIFSGCSLLRKRVEKKEKTNYTLSSKNKTKIRIENIKGEIKVTESSDTLGIITINAEKVAKVKYDDADKPITDIKISVDSSGSEIRVKSEFIESDRGIFNHSEHNWVNYDVKVPANMKVDVDNTNGSVILTRISDDVKVATVNGSVNINRCSGNITVEGTNGSVTGNFDSLKSLNIDVINGAVKLGGLQNVSAQLNVNTVHGKITNKELTITNLVIEKKNLSGMIGSGKGVIKITTTNGSVTLNAKDINFTHSRHDEFEGFKFDMDFDDDDFDTKTREKDKDAKTLESQPKVPDTPKPK